MGLTQPVWRLQQCTIMVQESMFSTVLKLGKFNILLTLLLFICYGSTVIIVTVSRVLTYCCKPLFHLKV